LRQAREFWKQETPQRQRIILVLIVMLIFAEFDFEDEDEDDEEEDCPLSLPSNWDNIFLSSLCGRRRINSSDTSWLNRSPIST
jgi:hypothetical protein